MRRINGGKSGRVSSRKKVSDAMLKRIAFKMYHADKRRNITAVIAIALSSMLVIMALSTILSIEAMMRRSRQMGIGTQAEGVYMSTSLYEFEKLKESGHFDAVSFTACLGQYETAVSSGDDNLILYADEEMASWNFNALLKGRWCAADGEIVVDERFVKENGGEIQVGDSVPILLKTWESETEQEAVVSGICSCNDVLEEARIYVSEAFFQENKSGTALQTYCRFENGRYTDEDLGFFLRRISPEAEAAAFVNTAAGDQPDAGYVKLIGALIALTVICAGLMIYTVYHISVVKNVVQYGQLKLIGVTGRQIKAIVRQHALRQYLTGFPAGCLLGAAFGYVFMPFLASCMEIGGACKFTVRPAYFLCAAVLSCIVVYIGIRKPMRILAGTPPIHAAGYTDSGRIKMGRVRGGRFTPGRFARRNIRRRRKNTALVACSLSIAILLFVTTMNMVHSLNLDALLSMLNLFADIEIATEDYLYGLEAGYSEVGFENNYAIPDAVRDELEKIPEDVETVCHYHLAMPVILDGEAAERYCKTVLDSKSYQKNIADDEWLCRVMAGRAMTYRKKGNPILLQENYRFYEYDQIADFEVFEGNLDREKFESGEYVIAVALDGDGNTYYHSGDVVRLYDEFPEAREYSYERDRNGKFPYFESLRTKEYTVLAVAGDSYRNQMAWGNECTSGFEYIFPAQLMESMERKPELFLVTINAPDAAALSRAEPYVKACLEKFSGEEEVSYRSRRTYRAGMEKVGMMIAMFGYGLAFLVGVMALVNFINSSVSGIAERKEEFSTLQAIGMMKRILLKALRLENLYTVLLAAAPGYLIGQFASVAAIEKVSERIPYLQCDVTLLPGILLAAVMGVLSMIYPNRRTDIGERRRRC